MNKLFASFPLYLNQTKFALNKHAPTIYMVAGVIGVVTSTVLACRATIKATEVLKESNAKLDDIRKASTDDTLVEKYTEEDKKKDLTTVYLRTSWDMVKLYSPSVVIGCASIGAIAYSHKMMLNRNAALATAYATTLNAFNNYRENVTNKYGEEEDQNLILNTKLKADKSIEPFTTTDLETGEVTENKIKTGEVDDDPYKFWFDSRSHSYQGNPMYDLLFLKAQENYATDLLVTRGHIFLNEVLDMLDLPRVRYGQVVGWLFDPNDPKKDNYVHFHMTHVKRRGANGELEPAIVLEFNVDGPILNEI